MSGFKAYQTYTALKAHFASGTYDAFQFKGKTKGGTWENYEKRNDRRFFEHVGSHHDMLGYLLANIVENRQFWIGDIDVANDTYARWRGRIDTLDYQFKEDLKRINLREVVKIKDGQLPDLIMAYMNRKICIETLTILIEILGLRANFDARIKVRPIWVEIDQRTRGYHPFLKYSKEKFKDIVKDILKET